MKQFTQGDLEPEFVDYLNEKYGDLEICGHFFDPSEVLLTMEPSVYESEFNNWLESNYIELIDSETGGVSYMKGVE